jgi:hypothetical protein
MKPICVTLLTLVSLALNVSAITYQGTFTGTATFVDSTAPLFGFTTIGDTFSGTYSYDSPTVDGTFTPNAGNLQVTITLPDSTVFTQSDAFLYPNFPSLAVSGGAVTDFLFIRSTPDYSFSVFNTSWSVFGDENVEFAAVGPVAYSNPTPARVGSVPDGGSSALLLGLAGLGLLSVRRWLVAA